MKATENTDRKFYNIMLKLVPVIIWALVAVSKILRSGSADRPFFFSLHATMVSTEAIHPYFSQKPDCSHLLISISEVKV